MNVFHFKHLGKLTGLGSIAGAVICLLNAPIFEIINNELDEDPFYVSTIIVAYHNRII